MALEQRVLELEQLQLRKCVEISGVPLQENQDLQQIVSVVQEKMNVNAKEVKEIKRLPIKKDRPQIIQVELISESAKNKWIAASRQTNISPVDIIPNLDQRHSVGKIVVREALTPYYKFLLGKTKHELKDTYKYIWCKDGRILIRKTDKSKVNTVRSESDIKAFL
ncbi:uncharacterized protein LOC124539198 [Vanessa cardui]|uniref:uncharacterized protein LOC124539198 n=1 Tax=Vanessa cardui TaxID=171605 RepID=UPI001F14723C|nr:uncharacterized protein LOC124539198 [Vanessa cardui]